MIGGCANYPRVPVYEGFLTVYQECDDRDLGKNAMNAKQIKDEIRRLSRIDKNEIYRWIDEEASVDLLLRTKVYRSREIRQGVEQKCRVIS